MEQLIEVIKEYLINAFRTELTLQGHVLTGKLNDSIEATALKTAKGFDIVFYAENYGGFLNEGVSADRIPYSRGIRRGGTSLYIQGLIAYVQRRMFLQGKEAVSVAFAIAATHKKEGMPTNNSYRFALNNRRLKWVDTVAKTGELFVEKQIEDYFANKIEILFVNYFSKEGFN